jgi:hypothetical protein
MVRHLAPSAALVAFFTVLIATTTWLPFWVPLCALSFNWIGAPLIGQWLESRNPSLDHENQEFEGFGWRIFAGWMTVFALGGWLNP